MRPAIPSSRPSSCANGLASLSGSDSTARIERGERGVLGVQLGHGLVEPLGQHADLGAVGQLGRAACAWCPARRAPRAGRGSRRASRRSAAARSRGSRRRASSMPRMRSNDMAVSALMGARASCERDGERQKIATRLDHPHGASPFGRSDPIGAVGARGERLVGGVLAWRVPVPLTVETVRDAPKVLLHDHLDGGLRPGTVIELADASATPACRPRDPTSWPLVPRRRPLRFAGALPGDVRAHRRA